MGRSECGCVYADASNTAAVRTGHEMGGYLKTPCERHAAPPPPAEQASGELLADLELVWHSVSDSRETNAAYERLKAALSQRPEQASGDTEQQARELFATHLERYEYRHGAAAIREGRGASYDCAAIAAIVAALSQRPVVDEEADRLATVMEIALRKLAEPVAYIEQALKEHRALAPQQPEKGEG